jgi:thiol-disulfide isomerase/thioredoxin
MTQLAGLVGRGGWLVVLSVALTQAQGASPSAGAKAPSFLPDHWVTRQGPVSAGAFRGRLILVDRWATWCGPCVGLIPHMNALADKFGKQGLTIIGITNEPVEQVRPFVERQDIRYLIGSGGAKGYVTRSIPHAWLISPAGKIIWEGYPTDLKEEVIREQLKNVSLPMRFELPAAMNAAEEALNAGHFGEGLRLLKSHADGSDPELVRSAHKTTDRVLAQGREWLQEADRLAKKAEYAQAGRLLRGLITSFDGSEIEASARARDAALREDPQSGVEYEGEDLLSRADELVAGNRPRQAAALAEQITQSPRFDNTKVRVKAQQLLTSIGPTAG